MNKKKLGKNEGKNEEKMKEKKKETNYLIEIVSRSIQLT